METMGVSLALRDTEKGKEIRKLTPLKPLKPFHNAIKTVVFSQDSKRIIALTKEGEGIIWDVQSGKELKRFASAEAMMQELMKLL